MSQLFDAMMTIEILMGLLVGATLASLVKWLIPGPGMATVEVLLVCAGLVAGIAWTIVGVRRSRGSSEKV